MDTYAEIYRQFNICKRILLCFGYDHGTINTLGALEILLIIFLLQTLLGFCLRRT